MIKTCLYDSRSSFVSIVYVIAPMMIIWRYRSVRSYSDCTARCLISHESILHQLSMNSKQAYLFRTFRKSVFRLLRDKLSNWELQICSLSSLQSAVPSDPLTEDALFITITLLYEYMFGMFSNNSVRYLGTVQLLTFQRTKSLTKHCFVTWITHYFVITVFR